MKKQKIDISSDQVNEQLECQTLANLVLESKKFLDKTQKLLGGIGVKVFTGTRGLAYDLLLKRKEAGKPINAHLLDMDLKKEKVAASVRGQFVDMVGSADLVDWTCLEEYLKELKDLAIKRERKRLALRYVEAVGDDKDPIQAKQELDKGITDIEAKVERKKFGMSVLESLNTPTKESFSPIGKGLFVLGRWTIFGASDGEGKTPLMVQLGLSVATGTTFLGLFPISEPLNVLHVSGENTKEDLDKKWKMQLTELEKQKGDVSKYLDSNYHVLYPYEVDIQLDKEGGTAWLEARLRQYSPNLLILDGLVNVLSTETSLNDDKLARKAGEALNKISRDFDCVIIITTHLRKIQTEEQKALDNAKPSEKYEALEGGIWQLFHGSHYFTNLAVSKVAMYRKSVQRLDPIKFIEFKFKTAETPPRILVERSRDTLWCKETTKEEMDKAKLLPRHLVAYLVEQCDGEAVPSIFEETAAEFLHCSQRNARDLMKICLDNGLMETKKGMLIPLVVKTRGEAKQKRGKGV